MKQGTLSYVVDQISEKCKASNSLCNLELVDLKTTLLQVKVMAIQDNASIPG